MEEKFRSDFTEYLIKVINKKIVLHLYIKYGMEGVVLSVDSKNQIFVFYDALKKKKMTFYIRDVAGIEGI